MVPDQPAAHEPGGWQRVVVRSDPARSDLAADLLWARGAAGIEEQQDGIEVVLLAGFAEADAARTAAEDLAAAGWGGASVVPVEDHGLDGWRDWARAERAGPWWIVPTWVDPPAGAKPDEVLWVDPGTTFGSGSHPTTRLCLVELRERVQEGQRVLDVGTGSGVLAIGAAQAGAAEVIAIDIDPRSPSTVEANAARNGVARLVHASCAPLQAVVDDPTVAAFDVVVANLLAPVIVELAEPLARSVRSDGTLVVSGLLDDRWEEAVGHLPMAVADVRIEDGWAAVVLAHPR